MTQRCFAENNCQLWSKAAALISFRNALYSGLNQINLICSLTHLQTSTTLTGVHTKESFHLSSPVIFRFSEDYFRNKDPFFCDICSL